MNDPSIDECHPQTIDVGGLLDRSDRFQERLEISAIRSQMGHECSARFRREVLQSVRGGNRQREFSRDLRERQPPLRTQSKHRENGQEAVSRWQRMKTCPFTWKSDALAVLVMVPAKAIAVSAVLVLAAAVVAAMSIRKRSFTMGLYTVVAWLFHTTAVPFGYLRPRRDPRQWIESRELGGQDAENAPAGLDGDGNRWTGVCQRVG